MTINKANIIIVGAGAAGLICARELSGKGYSVTVLEAKPHVGGRAHTIQPSGFSIPIETGAEFIHGDLPITKKLVSEAGLSLIKVGGQSWHRQNGELSTSQYFIEDWGLLMEKLQSLNRDMPIGNFLETEFADKRFEALRKSVIAFVEGYDAASISNASAFALREEWLSEDFDEQYRIVGGYSQLMEFLKKEGEKSGVKFFLTEGVKEIQWKKGTVNIESVNGNHFEAEKAIITIPLGILQSEGTLKFEPPISDKSRSVQKMGYGTVVKLIFEFKHRFWDQFDPLNDGVGMKKLGFFFSDAFIPTWWSQYPENNAILTGWFAGPKATDFLYTSGEEAALEQGINSLAYMFGMKEEDIIEQLKAWKIIDWSVDPFSAGAYSYATVETNESRKELLKPVEDTIYFAGEAIYEGPEIGTVEAALRSGLLLSDKL